MKVEHGVISIFSTFFKDVSEISNIASIITGVLSIVTFIISALSDQIGQKKCFQIIILSQFIQISYWIILVQFNLRKIDKTRILGGLLLKVL